MIAQPVTRPPAAPAAPAAGRPPRSTTPRASSSSQRSALPAPRGTGYPGPRRPASRPRVAAGPHTRRRIRAPCPASSDQSGSAARGRRPPARSRRAGSKPSTARSATRSSRSRSAPASNSGPNWRRRSRSPASSRRPRRDAGRLHRPRTQAARAQRRRADDAVRRAPGRRHPDRTPHRPAHRRLRPQRHGRHVLRRTRGCRAAGIAKKLTLKTGLTAEEFDLRERLQPQPHPNAEIR